MFYKLRTFTMALISALLVVISLQAIANATTITFSKIHDKIYVETDLQHYALYGQVTDKDGIRVIAVNGNTRAHQTAKCDADWNSMDKIDKDYSSIREAYLDVREKCLEASSKPKKSCIWSDTFTSDQKDYSTVRLDEDTVVYSSKYFPAELAKVIISGNVVIFVHYDGLVALKTKNCLYLNEKKLIAGIYKAEGSGNKLAGIFHPKGDGAIKKHIKSSEFNEEKFNLEQEYFKTYTTEDYARMDAKVRGSAFLWSEGWKS